MTLPTLGQMLLGTEGLALLRLSATDDVAARDARVAEIRSLIERYDSELAAPQVLPEYALVEGYQLWSETYYSPLRLFPIEEPTVHGLLETLPPCRILDAACGTGRHSAWLAGRGHEIVGVDASAAMLARAKSKIPGGTFELGDLTALPLPDAAVDAALCTLAMVHLPDLGPAFAELARVVRPGGRIVVSDVHPCLIQLGWQAQFRKSDGSAGFMRLNAHLVSHYAQAAVRAGLAVVNLHEPVLTPGSAVTVAEGPLPVANALAWAGLPGVVVWDFVKPG